MIILGIESTCDETGVGIVKDGREILANVVASSIVIHKKFGGVVPEVAAREQSRCIIPVIHQCVSDAANINGIPKIAQWIGKNIDAIAVTHGPGLIGSLLVGVETAKTLALVWSKPLVAVNHLIGHVYANWLGRAASYQGPETSCPKFPLVALIVSGGHTDLILMTDHGKYEWLGGTRDDAAGEAFDKVARILGLGYPGGPEVERLAASYQRPASQAKRGEPETSINLPRPMISEDNFDFSFSGIKTAVVNLVARDQKPETSHREIAYEFQEAIVDVLVTKTLRAAKRFGVKSIVVGGGVAANEKLRSQFAVYGSQLGIPIFFPSKELSIDNGVMIAAASYWQKRFVDPLKLQADPSLYFI